MYDLVISSEKISDDTIVIKSTEQFLNWFFDEKPFDKKIKFVKISDDVKNIYYFLNYYLKVKKVCENKIDYFNDLFSKEDNIFLKEALDQFISSNSGGKFLRSFLVALGYQSFGENDDNYLPLAMALEFFQTSILIHDDIIDKALKRRGKDTIPLKYQKLYSNPILKDENFNLKKKDISDSMALCLGDLGFYLANKIIVNNYSNNSNLSIILNYYDDIAIKTCKGEMIDIILPFYEEYYGLKGNREDNIFEIYKLKTAWYSVVGPFVLGCLLAGKNNVKIIESTLINLGIAYQIKDDLLGIYGDEVEIGKSSVSDIEEFKQTLLYSFTVNTSYKDELLKYYGKKNISKSGLNKIRNIFDKSGAKDYCLKTMNRLFSESIEGISKLEISGEYKSILLGFAEFLMIRSK